MTITPMQGDEFTQRLLTPFQQQKMTMLLQQGYDIDALLRLMTSELRVKGGKDGEVVCFNRPTDREGYTTFRRIMAHLSSVQDRHALRVDPVQFRVTKSIAASNMSTEDLKDPRLTFDPDKQVYKVQSHVTGRVILTNFDMARLSIEERIAIEEEAARYSANELLIDIRAGYPGGEYPIHAVLRLRSFFNILAFLGRDIAVEPEFHVGPDPRTPAISENPVHTLEVVEATSAPRNAGLSVSLGDKTYSLRPQEGYQWNKKAFSLLYQLFQMSVAPSNQPSPMITIGK